METLDLAKYIITKRNKMGSPISNLALQHNLYYIKKVFLWKDVDLIKEEPTAWIWGPGFKVYDRYCGFGAQPLRLNYEVNLPKKYKKELDELIEKLADFEIWDLVRLNMDDNSAWLLTYDRCGARAVITNEMMAHFS